LSGRIAGWGCAGAATSPLIDALTKPKSAPAIARLALPFIVTFCALARGRAFTTTKLA
jgi:hypothetical protein